MRVRARRDATCLAQSPTCTEKVNTLKRPLPPQNTLLLCWEPPCHLVGKQGRRGCVALGRDERRTGGTNGAVEAPGQVWEAYSSPWLAPNSRFFPAAAKFVPLPARSDTPAHRCPWMTSWLTRSGRNTSSCGLPRAEPGPPDRFRGAPPPTGKRRKGLFPQGCDALRSVHGN